MLGTLTLSQLCSTATQLENITIIQRTKFDLTGAEGRKKGSELMSDGEADS